MERSALDMIKSSEEKVITFWLFISLLGSSMEPVLIKYFNLPISPLSLLILKSLVGGVLILPLYSRLRTLSSEVIVSAIPVALLAFLTNGLIFLALQTLSATVLITLITITPLLVGIFNHWRGSERIGYAFVIAFCLVFLGVGMTVDLVISRSDELAQAGILFVLISVLTSSIYRIRIDDLTKKISPFNLSCSLFIINALFSLLLFPFASIPSEAVPLGIWLGFAGVMANIAFLAAIKVLGSTRVSFLSVLQRPLAVALGALLLSEVVSMKQLVGMSMVFGGVYLSRKRPVSNSQKKNSES